MGFPINKAAVFRKNDNDEGYKIYPREEIRYPYVFIMYCPVLSCVPAEEKPSGLVIIQTDVLDQARFINQ